MVVLVSDFVSLLDCYGFCGVQTYWNVLSRLYLCLISLVDLTVIVFMWFIAMSDFISLLDCYRYCGVNCHVWLC